MQRLLSSNPSKALMEQYVLLYSPVWMGTIAAVVAFQWYESFGPNGYLCLGVLLAVPCFLGPLLFTRRDPHERRLGYTQRYFVKANLFIAIISYIGHHFYTQYFYAVLGMRYTGPLQPGRGIDINGAPLSMLFVTHVYFMSYHVLVSPLYRAARGVFAPGLPRTIASAVFVLVAAFFTAFTETLAMSAFPYYTYPDFTRMLTLGSVFYGTFFVVTFPWFCAMDEDPVRPWPIASVAVAALAAMMVVLLCAEFWRLTLDSLGLVEVSEGVIASTCRAVLW